MKYLQLLLASLLPLILFSQNKWYKITSNDIIICSAQFVAGAADGMNQVLYTTLPSMTI